MGNRTTLNRALSKLGLCSRTDAIKLIREGNVIVNNTIVTKSLAWVDIEHDKIILLQNSNQNKNDITSNQKVKPVERKNIYLAMYKPKGYITTKSDEHGRKTVYDLLPEKYKLAWLFPVGRLDKDSQGLLLFTNDGSWQDYILAPKTYLKKTYLVWTEKPLTQKDIAKLEGGIRIADYSLQSCTITPEQDYYRVIISEGKNRQIRKMMAYIGTRVTKLERIQIGNLSLKKLNLKPREVKEINPRDIE